MASRSLSHRLVTRAIATGISAPAWRNQMSINSQMVAAARRQGMMIPFSTMQPSSSVGEKITYIRLNNLQDNPGATKQKRRVGRGIGSSKGKTSGKGHKGQRARNRSAIPNGFEGGQTALWKVLPKRGFNNKRHEVQMTPVNLGTIQDYIDMGRLSTDKVVTVVELIRSGMIRDKANLHGIKLLSKGKERFRTPLRFEVNRASEAAIEAAEAVPGGQVTTVHHNRLALRSLIRPEKFVIPPKLARPPPKYHAYYTNWKNRGYLCPEVQMRNWLTDHHPNLKDAFEEALKTQHDKAAAADK